MSRELTAPSERLIAAARVAAAIFFDGEQLGKLRAIDVGCDHAKLAIYLVQSGICSHVLATDIGDGPIEKAREAVSRRKLRTEPLDRYISVRQNDGLKGLENEPAERIFILGMGGELISTILDNAPFLQDVSRKTLFVLQAMTDEAKLRRYLCENGFAILREELVRDKGRIYAVLACVYDGVRREMSEGALVLGSYHAQHPHPELFLPYIDRKIRIVSKTLDQRRAVGLAVQTEEALLLELQTFRKEGEERLERKELS